MYEGQDRKYTCVQAFDDGGGVPTEPVAERAAQTFYQRSLQHPPVYNLSRLIFALFLVPTGNFCLSVHNHPVSSPSPSKDQQSSIEIGRSPVSHFWTLSVQIRGCQTVHFEIKNMNENAGTVPTLEVLWTTAEFSKEPHSVGSEVTTCTIKWRRASLLVSSLRDSAVLLCLLPSSSS